MGPEWLIRCGARAVRWVARSYPNEGCALIVQSADTFRVIETSNLADRYHDADPSTYPCSGRTTYIIDPLEFVYAEERGESVVAIVHSHCDAGDYFSEADVAAATMAGFDGDASVPTYPGVEHLVVSVWEDGANAASLFRFCDCAFARVGRWRIEHGEIIGETTSST